MPSSVEGAGLLPLLLICGLVLVGTLQGLAESRAAPSSALLVDPLHSGKAAWPAYGHSVQTTARWAPFLPLWPYAPLSGAYCPQRMPCPLLRRN